MPNKALTRACILITLVLFSQSVFSHQTGKKEKEKKATLHFSVFSKGSHKPLKDAEVWVKSEAKDADFDQTAKTDREGSVSFSGVPYGAVTVEVTAKGWKTYHKKDKVERDDVSFSVELDAVPEEEAYKQAKGPD